MHQNVQDRLYEEVRSFVTDRNNIDYDTLPNLKYMEQVLKESMRVLPVSHILGREADANIQLTDCTVPKGTLLILCVLKMHRDVKIWGPTANEFDPDRFLPEAVAQRHAFALVPFLAGPRSCIGHKYAMISMKMMLCYFLLAYKITTRLKMSDLVFKTEFLLRLENEYVVKLEKRQSDSPTTM